MPDKTDDPFPTDAGTEERGRQERYSEVYKWKKKRREAGNDEEGTVDSLDGNIYIT